MQLPPPPPPPPQTIPIPEKKQEGNAQEFMDSISAATTFLEYAQREGKRKASPAVNSQVSSHLLANLQQNDQKPKVTKVQQKEMAGVVQEFIDSLSASTHGLEGSINGGEQSSTNLFEPPLN